MLDQIEKSDHYWDEYRNFAGPAIASLGYGLVAAALAEASNGLIVSFGYAFEPELNGQTADQFLAWWADRQMF